VFDISISLMIKFEKSQTLGETTMVTKIILKNRVQFSSTMEKTLAGELKNLSTETRIPASKLLDEAISDLLAKYGKKVRS